MQSNTVYKITDLDTEKSIQLIKDIFLSRLKENLRLHQVYAPLYVNADTGINDDLNGVEKPLTFNIKNVSNSYAIVHSLAKWKRIRLQELNIPVHEGIVTNMIALRLEESLSHMHSVVVDQWDWEMHIEPKDRSLDFLKQIVSIIYSQVKFTEVAISEQLGGKAILPANITFIHSEDLYELYPDKTPKERENLIVEEHGAVFLIGIGNRLINGEPHDSRAPDYDDWITPTSDKHFGLNGDILLWHPIFKKAFELSSMGIRVDSTSLERQLHITNTNGRRTLPFHSSLLAEKLPLSIGGGIGQSRLCMFLLGKKHIGEVQYCE